MGGGKAAEVPASRSLARYAALSVIDTQANYLIVQAFRYTSLTSVTLLDCAAIPFSMALSRAALGGAYARGHVAEQRVHLHLPLPDKRPVHGQRRLNRLVGLRRLPGRLVPRHLHLLPALVDLLEQDGHVQPQELAAILRARVEGLG